MSETQGGSGGKIAIRIGIAAVLLLVAVFLIRHFSKEETEIRITHADYGDIVSSISTNGKVVPVQNFQEHATEPGTVEAVYVQAGQQVAKGTLLLRLNSAAAEARVDTARSAVAQAAAARADIQSGGSKDERIVITGDLDRARLQTAQSQRDVAALQSLQAKGAASANEVAAAQQRLATAQSQLASLEQRATQRYAPTDRQRVDAQVQDSRGNLNAAEQSLAKSIVRAPFAGTIYSLPVRAYDFVATGDALVQLADLNRMQVFAYFDEPEIGKLHVNDPVTIRWEAKPRMTWHGHIARVPTTVTTYGTRFVGECLIIVDDASGDLLPYTNVNVSVTTQQIRHVLSLPREALRTEGSDNFVFLIRGNKLVKTAVQVGALNLQSVQITQGIRPSDAVALHALNSEDLTNGMTVKVVQQ